MIGCLAMGCAMIIIAMGGANSKNILEVVKKDEMELINRD